VAVGDLNGDQHPDIAAGSSVPGGVAIWYRDGRGGWSPPLFLPTKGDVRSLAVADLDMDGRPDLAVSIKGEFTGIQIWLNRGKGQWEKGQPPADSGEFNGIRAADVNGDGHPDLIATASEAEGPGGIKVWLGDGKGGWLAEVGPTARGEYSDVVAADFNEDGHLDIAGSGRGLHGALRVWLGDGAGGWSELQPLEEGSFYGLSTGDLNKDRHLDLFAGTYRSGIRIYLGDGRGGFVGLKPPVERGNFSKVVCGDVDGDGAQEIVASPLDGEGIQVWKGVESGFSVIPAFYESPFTCYDLALADLDGDGRQDLVAASNGGGVAIWTGQGRTVSKGAVGEPSLGRLPEQEGIPVSPPENRVFVEKEGQAQYRVGPGDILEISLWTGLKVDRYLVAVRTDGKISFAYFEDLSVSGLTVPQLDAVITETLSKFVRHPQVDVMVKEYNSKSITVLGEINVLGNRISGPGTYTLKGRTTLLKALSIAGGPTEKANLRQVSVRRESGETYTLNLYKTISQGDMSQNLVLDDGDMLVVPSLAEGRRVFVLGEVTNPGIYPIRDRLSVVEAVSMAGGFKQTAVLGSARIVRGDLRKPEVLACNLKGILDRGDMSQNFSLRDGDVVYIPKNTLGSISDFLREISPILEFIIYPSRVYRAYE
jgi:protein involved in polysaccharide export with SLBB domain